MSKTKPKTRISENLNLLLASVALAFLIWVFAKAGETRETKLEVPVVVSNEDPRIETTVEPSSISVQLRYGKDAAPHINSDNFRFKIDTAELREKLGVEWTAKSLTLSEKDW